MQETNTDFQWNDNGFSRIILRRHMNDNKA